MRGFQFSFRDDGSFDDADAFVPENLPGPGTFLDGHDVLVDQPHAAFHRLTADLFEERGVYDVTFGYNLALLNRDSGHPDAGYRYAKDVADSSVLRAEFTPTTPFCPQSRALTIASFRAWNELADRHEYDLLRVHVAESHHESAPINVALDRLAERYCETGAIPRSLTVDGSVAATDLAEFDSELPF